MRRRFTSAPNLFLRSIISIPSREYASMSQVALQTMSYTFLAIIYALPEGGFVAGRAGQVRLKELRFCCLVKRPVAQKGTGRKGRRSHVLRPSCFRGSPLDTNPPVPYPFG